MCEEFHCTPLEALAQPYQLTMEIIEVRAYTQAKSLVENAQKAGDVPDHPMVDLVGEFTTEDYQRVQDQHNARQGGLGTGDA